MLENQTKPGARKASVGPAGAFRLISQLQVGKLNWWLLWDELLQVSAPDKHKM